MDSSPGLAAGFPATETLAVSVWVPGFPGGLSPYALSGT